MIISVPNFSKASGHLSTVHEPRPKQRRAGRRRRRWLRRGTDALPPGGRRRDARRGGGSGARRRRGSRAAGCHSEQRLQVRDDRLRVVRVEQTGVAAQAVAAKAVVDERRAADHPRAGGADPGLLRVVGDRVLAPDWADLPDRSPAGKAPAEANALRGAQQAQLLSEHRGDHTAWGGRWEERFGEAQPF